MKASHGSFALLAALLLSACASGGSITRTPKGGYHANAPYTLLGDQDGVVSEITTKEGDVIKFVAKKQSGTRGLLAYLKMKLGIGLANAAASTQIAQTNADRDVAIGAQSVIKNKDTLDAAGKATSEALPHALPESVIVQPIKPPGS